MLPGSSFIAVLGVRGIELELSSRLPTETTCQFTLLALPLNSNCYDPIIGSATPIMVSRVTKALRSSLDQPSVPAGRVGSTRYR